MNRVLAIWLDGFETDLLETFGLHRIRSLMAESATARLDHGADRLSGLAGEHLATGLGGVDSGRRSAVEFDPATYRCVQVGTVATPLYGAVPTVVFDPSYFDLESSSPGVTGVVDWGSHDPGCAKTGRPDGLYDEVIERFGRYPATDWLYGSPWQSAAECRRAGRSLTTAVGRRLDAVTWLLEERLPDWQLAIVGVSEAHSASEKFFHGLDPNPMWQGVRSVPTARQAMRSVYAAVDEFVGALVDRFPDAVHVVFAMHGMGPNDSDVASTVLIGDLLRRWSGGNTADVAFPTNDHGLPLLSPFTTWSRAVRQRLGQPVPPAVPAPLRRLRNRVRRRTNAHAPYSNETSLMGHALMRYQPDWPRMRAFATPSYYDGRIRINLKGRERDGVVEPHDYEATVAEIEAMLYECRDLRTGAPAVVSVERPFADPFAVPSSDADLTVTWNRMVLGISHPTLGTFGPVPPARTGGHTSPFGFCAVHGPGIASADLGARSAHDVVPTLLRLSGSPVPEGLSGVALPVCP